MTNTRKKDRKRTELDALVWSTPAALFALLESARDANEFERAARIQERLRELGVAVLFQPRSSAPAAIREEVRDGAA